MWKSCLDNRVFWCTINWMKCCVRSFRLAENAFRLERKCLHVHVLKFVRVWRININSETFSFAEGDPFQLMALGCWLIPLVYFTNNAKRMNEWMNQETKWKQSVGISFKFCWIIYLHFDWIDFRILSRWIFSSLSCNSTNKTNSQWHSTGLFKRERTYAAMIFKLHNIVSTQCICPPLPFLSPFLLILFL